MAVDSWGGIGQSGRGLLALGLVALLTGCGSSSSTSTAKLSPTQYSNAQRVETYRLALGKILAPFTHPQPHPEDLAHADTLLRTSISQLRRLVPPPAFASVHADFIRDTQAERAALSRLASARRANDAIAVSNASARAAQATARYREDIQHANAVLQKCKADNFSC